jgi:hypothetical protein
MSMFGLIAPRHACQTSGEANRSRPCMNTTRPSLPTTENRPSGRDIMIASEET